MPACWDIGRTGRGAAGPEPLALRVVVVEDAEEEVVRALSLLEEVEDGPHFASKSQVKTVIKKLYNITFGQKYKENYRNEKKCI